MAVSKRKRITRRVSFVIAASFYSTVAMAQESKTEPYSPTLRSKLPDKVLWGDLHLHSNLSMDAFTLGNKTLGPEDAYRFARGETIESTAGGPAKLVRPLDFLSITDHAEYVGAMAGLTDEKVSNWIVGDGEKKQTLLQALKSTVVGKRWADYLANGEDRKATDEFVAAVNNADNVDLLPAEMQQSLWQKVSSIADEYNEPGLFTAMIGYEWTTIYTGNNLHRVVIFKDDASVTSQVRPFSSIDSQDPEDLWAALSSYEEVTGGSVMAIPHNGNLSNGIMFAETKLDGETAVDADYAIRRARWEPLYEVTQVKGDSEAHPTLSPDDEFADFESWDAGNIAMSAEKTNDMLQYEYGRSALQVGLRLEDKIGVNPYKFGMIGSTDSHTGLATADNDNFFGKFPGSEPTIDRFTNRMASTLWPNITITSSGYTAVWTRENTRAEIFDALKRKEVYASTGPRINLRVFAGWNFDGDELNASNFAELGYAKGVPMGGNLSSAAEGKAPTFLVRASRDPMGANLDRIQMIKGWVDASGKSQEEIFNISLSDGREADENNVVPVVGNTVDTAAATYSNSIGDPELSVVWTDPKFDAGVDVFYYLRVLEIPTPRWTTYDAERFGVDLPSEVPATLQERAYSSPIWYSSN